MKHLANKYLDDRVIPKKPNLFKFIFKKNGLKHYKEEKQKYNEIIKIMFYKTYAKIDKMITEKYESGEGVDLKPDEKVKVVQITELGVTYDIINTKNKKRHFNSFVNPKDNY